MAAHGASSSSSSSKLWKYDVFLSFRGEDTRKGFTGHLHTALEQKGYKAFIDEDDLKRGEEIKPELLRAIEESRISIIVFSKRYADSSWCLDELVKIMECRSKLKQHVMPIFYDVEASEIRKQEGSLALMFQKHEENIRKEEDDKKREAKRERVKQWREALYEAANLSGHDLKNENGHEAKLIKKIIYENLWEWLPRKKKLHVADFPVGINSRVQEIITYLSSGEGNKVLMVGIWGMGGLGKTTAAKAIYNQIHHEFEFKSFLADVSDTTSKHGLVHLQKNLSFDIMDQEIKISTVDEGIGWIEEEFSHRKVLVVMDNIDGVEQLNAIAGNHKWFGPGSRIIITTRDKHLLLKVDKVYLAQILNEEEALELFSWHAFGNSCPNIEYFQLSKKIVSYCGGLPLALRVLGIFLCGSPPKVWNSELEKLERTPDGKIIKPLRMSFDGLDDTEKATFLHISCFFIGEDEDRVTKLLNVCGFSATIGINVLRERCLVTVEGNKLSMHDLIREMAKVIISEKSPGDPGKWSRLWNREDVTDVLTYQSGTEEVEGLDLHFPDPWLAFAMTKHSLFAMTYQSGTEEVEGLDLHFPDPWPGSSNKHSFSTEAFANMKKLRLLRLYNVELNGEYKHLPKELIWLCWEECPLQSIPDDFFNQPRLVVLEMQFSKLVQVWEGSKSLQKLKIINLRDSRFLIKSPDFSQVPNLEELILEGCWMLTEIHPSIGHLKRLSLVNLQKCYQLISLPKDFYKSKSVETLLLNGCSKFREVHEDIGEMISLRILEADATTIRQVPPSILRVKNLTRISLLGVQKLQQWEEALTDNGYEAELIWKIIYGNVWEWLPSTNKSPVAKHPVRINCRFQNDTTSHLSIGVSGDKIITEWLPSADKLYVAKHVVGINSRVQDIITFLLSGESDDVVMVGIWGMGGLGKTSAAKAIFNEIHPMFEFKSFLAEVGGTSESGLAYLQEKLIFDILKKKSKISSVHSGIDVIKQQFRHKKVLVIIDNVDEAEQLDAIAGNHDWFGPGSRIIITSRDKRLLQNADNIYLLEEMNGDEALELLSWHAFGNRRPEERYLEVSKEVVSYCGGLPLALEVLGSFLFKRPITEWKSQLEKLKRTPKREIIKSLRISFEGLDDAQKAIFLDISCFFIGRDKDYVAKVLDGCGFLAKVGISVLCERCLVTVEDNKLNMHKLLREMARAIIFEKTPGHPGRRSRLWNPGEVTDVLTYEDGTEEVEGLDLCYSNNASFSTKAFAKMTNLRLLKLGNVELNGEYKHLPKELIWLCWEGCPLRSIPDDFFNQPRLVVLEMQRSKLVQVWEGSKSLQMLKIINLSESYDLEKSPDFSQVPNLEELVLEECWSLSEIHSSMGHLKRLYLVNLKGCRTLLGSLPRDFNKSKSVETLPLDGCNQLEEPHEDLGEMISLRILEADARAIRQVPPSIVRLDLGGNNFHTLPSLSGLSKLQTLRLTGCRYLHTLPDLPTNLKFLIAGNCSALETMPNFSKMSNMRELNVSDSAKLTEIPGLDKSLNSMTWIHMKRCTNLTADFTKNILQGWTSYGFGGIFLHGNYVPDWFEFVNYGNKVMFDVPLSDDRNFKGLTLFCLYHSYKTNHFPHPLDISVINNTKSTKLWGCISIGGLVDPTHEDDYLWQGQLSNDELNLQGGDKVDIFFEHPYPSVDGDFPITIKRTGVNLVWDKHPTQFYDEGGPSHDASDNNHPSNQMRITQPLWPLQNAFAPSRCCAIL